MKYRKLRIAWSVGCGIPCVLLIVLSVFDFTGGTLAFHYLAITTSRPILILPYWLVAILVAGLAVAPWIRWSNRFSLRTLLVGMTVVAVILGVAVWAAK